MNDDSSKFVNFHVYDIVELCLIDPALRRCKMRRGRASTNILGKRRKTWTLQTKKSRKPRTRTGEGAGKDEEGAEVGRLNKQRTRVRKPKMMMQRRIANLHAHRFYYQKCPGSRGR